MPPEKSDENITNYYESDYYIKGGHLGPGWPRPMPSWFRNVMEINSMRLLGLKYFAMMMPWSRRAWVRALEDAFCYAFAKSVNGVVLDTYSLDGT